MAEFVHNGEPSEGETKTVDDWRHRRMRASVLPLVSAYPQAHWLTVGDWAGRDARWLQEHGLRVTASDLVVEALLRAQEEGSLGDVRQENAEALTLEDESVDFVFCKEAFHHFTRPMIGLYEMLRVSRRGVVLIEPDDRATYPTKLGAVLLRMRNSARRATARPIIERGDGFETVGNYIYAVSVSEVRKAAIALGHAFVASKPLNDYYREADTSHEATWKTTGFRRARSRVALYDTLTWVGLRPAALAAVVVLKDVPDAGLMRSMRRTGYQTEVLPVNPYASATA